MKIVCVSGGFDPIHVGHIRMIQEAAKYGQVAVILNNDNWLITKKGYVFMPELEREEILMSIKGVYEVLRTFHVSNPSDMSVATELRVIRPDIFCNGGDRNLGNIPTAEERVCKELGIEMLYNVGGGKIQSSSKLVKDSRIVLEAKE